MLELLPVALMTNKPFLSEYRSDFTCCHDRMRVGTLGFFYCRIQGRAFSKSFNFSINGSNFFVSKVGVISTTTTSFPL